MSPRSFRDPCRKARVSVFLDAGMTICLVYLDEFGHIGPFMSRDSPKHNESPVFGLAGIILPEQAIRPFATKFLQLKEYIFAGEIKASGKLASHWEKHGTHIFTPKLVARYPHFRSTGFRILNYVRDFRGRVFYYGREKIRGTLDVNSVGLTPPFSPMRCACSKITAYPTTRTSSWWWTSIRRASNFSSPRRKPCTAKTRRATC
jgi:hypothetical protein